MKDKDWLLALPCHVMLNLISLKHSFPLNLELTVYNDLFAYLLLEAAWLCLPGLRFQEGTTLVATGESGLVSSCLCNKSFTH